MVTGDSLMTACYVAKACGIMGRVDNDERVGTGITSTSASTSAGSGTDDEVGTGGDVVGDVVPEEGGVLTAAKNGDNKVVDSNNTEESPQRVQSSQTGEEREEEEQQQEEILTLSLVDAEASGTEKKRKHIVWTDLSGQVKYRYELSQNSDNADNSGSSKADDVLTDDDDGEEDDEDVSTTVHTHAHTVQSTSAGPPLLIPQELRGQVGMSARDLSVIGGYNLATTGKVIRYLHEQANEGDEHCMGALSELVHFKVKCLLYFRLPLVCAASSS
jgi:hypothetical protein